jgi:hypothetical protein
VRGQLWLVIRTVSVLTCFACYRFWLWALPVDTIKSVVQTSDPSAHKGPKGSCCSRHVDPHAGVNVAGVVDVVRTLTAEHGVARLFRGWQAAFIRGLPGAAVTLATHAAVVRALSQ